MWFRSREGGVRVHTSEGVLTILLCPYRLTERDLCFSFLNCLCPLSPLSFSLEKENVCTQFWVSPFKSFFEKLLRRDEGLERPSGWSGRVWYLSFLPTHKEGPLMFIESAFMVTAIKDAIVSADMTSCVMLTFDRSTEQATKIKQCRLLSGCSLTTMMVDGRLPLIY